uniref:Na_Ca_ex domain-containing protein n=1 Tax=Macrostomum lignano TaxID=282301 RepID=A0A1I8HWI2_9PLAT
NVAGVTLLALGNGAPDIFSAISSITTLKDGDAGLAFGALLGAGIFVTAVTAGAIAIVKPFTAMSRPLMKDIVFYMFTIFWAFIVMFRQTITLVDSIGFIVLYVLYVILTVVSRALYSQASARAARRARPGTEAVAGAQDEVTGLKAADIRFLSAPLNGWSRILNSVHCAIAPVFIALAFKGYNWMIPFEGGGGFPIVVIVLIVGIALGILVYFTSSDFEPPKYHAAFAFIGFLTAIVWIYTFANEVVNILESVGSIFRISSTILGLTVLAWANSIGDVIANTVLARQNFPRVAISACFGGPLFNLLLGVGIPFTIKLLSDGTTEMRIEASVVQLLLVVSVTASLIVSMVYLTVMRFKLGRVYGIILIVLYLAFLVVALLAETGQLPPLIDRN